MYPPVSPGGFLLLNTDYLHVMEDVLLLHGAIGAADQLQDISKALSNKYEAHTLNFSGHGGTTMPAEPFSMQLFSNDVLRYLDEHKIERVSIFGYSMGGYVAMYLAKHYPERINKIVTLATKFHWDEAIAAKEIQMLDADKIAAKVPAFAEALEKRHAPNDWKLVLSNTADMLDRLGADNTLKPGDYTSIQTPVLILLGDRDKMIGLEETVAVYKALPNAQMGMLPATPHPIEQADVARLSYFISNYL